jgi:cell division protein FtsW
MSLSAKLSAELKGDRIIWVVMLLLSLCSLLAVYSASLYLSNRSGSTSTESYLFSQIMLLGMGFVVTWFLHRLHYLKFSLIAPWLMLISVPLLAFTMFFGSDINQASRWVNIGGVSFQSSDLARFALILFVARALTQKQEVIKDFSQAFLPIIMPILVIVGLIAPVNLSTALIIFMVSLMMMFIGRVDIKFIFLLFIGGIILFGALLVIGQAFPGIIRSATWISRLNMFWNGVGDTHQVDQSMIAIANGGLFGVGPGNSVQRHVLPYAYADYIYAIIVEEYGLIGGCFIATLYGLLLLRVVRLATKSAKTFGAMAAIGLGLNIVVQAFANMAVSVNVLPATGLTLPLVSKGGSSILFTFVALGVILSISRYNEKIS